MKNNWIIAIRNFQRNKFYGIINVAGLTIGMAACFLIVMYLQHELGFDKFFKKCDHIYQVALSVSFGGDEFDTSNTPPPVGETLVAEFPEIESYTRHYMSSDVVMRYEDQKYTESNVWMVDSNFLEFFSFPLLEGDKTTCLYGTNSIVLTETIAKKYFGDASAMGKEVFLKNEVFTVTGILKDLPRQSSLQFDVLAPMAASGVVDRFSWSWVWLQVDTYVRLQEQINEAELSALEAKFPAMVRQHAAGAFERIGQNLEEFYDQGNRWELSLNPLSKVHLRSPELSSRLATKGDIGDLYIFGTIGFFILLLACINFMNLSTARSMGRSMEVGVRKVLGSGRSTLIHQFLSEAMLYSFAAALVAIALVQLMLPAFNQMINQELGLIDLMKGWTLAVVLPIPIIAGLLAGSYPALYLSNFKPLAILKSRMTTSNGRNTWVRSGLVIFQFATSIVLVICTLVVLQQIQFSMNGDLGMDKENVLIIRNAQHLGEKAKSFKDELSNLPEVVESSISTGLPAGGAFGDFYVPNTDSENPNLIEDLTLYSYLVDEGFIATMGIEILEGRNFDEKRGLDSLAVIINESTAKMVGWENPIGKYLTYPGGQNTRFEVVGVMKDFHNLSFRESIEPFALFHESSKTYSLGYTFLAIKIRAEATKELLGKSKALWAAFAPDAPFSFTFLDDDINAQYQSEERLGSVLSSFTFLSIFVACLGLLGLIAYTTEQRTKEIGIRKVLGATVASITGMLAKDFLKLVVAAVFIAIPVAWFFMTSWLLDFEYRIEIAWWVFASAGAIAILIAFLTVSFQSVKAAMANPVDSLKNE